MYHCTEKSIVVLATFQLDINSNPGKIRHRGVQS